MAGTLSLNIMSAEQEAQDDLSPEELDRVRPRLPSAAVCG